MGQANVKEVTFCADSRLFFQSLAQRDCQVMFNHFYGHVPGRNNVRSRWANLIISNIFSGVGGLRTGLNFVPYNAKVVHQISGESCW